MRQGAEPKKKRVFGYVEPPYNGAKFTRERSFVNANDFNGIGEKIMYCVEHYFLPVV